MHVCVCFPGMHVCLYGSSSECVCKTEIDIPFIKPLASEQNSVQYVYIDQEKTNQQNNPSSGRVT